MITKKTLKQISKGNYSMLINAIEDLLSLYNEDLFDTGYKSCLSDLEVYAKELTERLTDTAEFFDNVVKKDNVRYYLLDQSEIEKIISDFFKNKLNNYGRK